MNCPYSESKCASDIPATAQRCQCRRFIRRCTRCNTSNRAFANFCRACGTTLPASGSNWSGYKGGPHRLGLNSTAVGAELAMRDAKLKLQLGGPCRSLLGYDGHLIAVSDNGVVEIGEPLLGKRLCRFQTAGKISVAPCIEDGILFLGAPGQLSAYSLAPTTLDTPRVRQLWQMPVQGTPIHALTVVGSRLFVSVASPDRQEVQVIDQADTAQPSAPRTIHAGRRLSWTAADPNAKQAVFFSHSDSTGVLLHVAGSNVATHRVALDAMTDDPIAFLGGSVFGVFGSARRLYRIDAASGTIVEPLDKDTHLFALSRSGEEWDRDGVHIDSRGVTFRRTGIRDTFGTHERAVRGSPLIVQGSAAIVGMEDGSVRVYDFVHAPRYESWVVGDGNASITALATFESYVTAGNSEGVVEVRELRAKGATR